MCVPFHALQSTRTLQQLHYMNWPDHGVPDSIPPILEMLQEMRSIQAHDDVPICIHCRSETSSLRVLRGKGLPVNMGNYCIYLEPNRVSSLV